MLENQENAYRMALITEQPYTLPFKFWSNSDIQVWVTKDGVDHQLLATEYTIEEDMVTLTEEAYEDYQSYDSITFIRVVAPVQSTDYTNGTHIDAEVIEQSLDKLTAIAQQLTEAQKRSIKTSVSEEGSDVTLPREEERANSLLVFGPDGKTMGVRSIDGFDAAVASASANAQAAIAAKNEAESKAGLSRQYAEGKKFDGSDVVPGESGHHNNSKYWAEEAARIRPTVDTELDLNNDGTYTLTLNIVYNSAE